VIRHRARQFFDHDVEPGPGERSLAAHFLDGDLGELFFAQEARDVVHAANTARWLLDRGHDDRELIQAALLHDIGKGHQRRRDRVAHVLTDAAGIGRFAADARSPMEMRRALARARGHAVAGAAMLSERNVTGRVLNLVKMHHERAGEDGMLRLLQEADSAT
jgi:putative nucleotidyltransferase with HDIG domain